MHTLDTRGPAWMRDGVCGIHEMFAPDPTTPEAATAETCPHCLYTASLEIPYADRVEAQAKCGEERGHWLLWGHTGKGEALYCAIPVGNGYNQYRALVCVHCGYFDCCPPPPGHDHRLRLAACALRVLGREGAAELKSDAYVA